jgi:hypothetical protein
MRLLAVLLPFFVFSNVVFAGSKWETVAKSTPYCLTIDDGKNYIDKKSRSMFETAGGCIFVDEVERIVPQNCDFRFKVSSADTASVDYFFPNQATDRTTSYYLGSKTLDAGNTDIVQVSAFYINNKIESIDFRRTDLKGNLVPGFPNGKTKGLVVEVQASCSKKP